jgi:regulator of replication initiation timing
MFSVDNIITMPSATEISPESAPSLSATSHASSHADHIVRELFPTRRREGTEVELNEFGQAQLREEDSQESSIGSNISVSSSGNIDMPSVQLRYHDESPEGSAVNVFPGSCQGAVDFSPKGLATMLNIFDASQRNDAFEAISTSDSVNDAVTEVTSNIDHSIVAWERKMDSLEREITTLKEIIKADSVTILCLKTDLCDMQERELQMLDEINKHERSLSMSLEERKTNAETIQHLQEKINALTGVDGGKDASRDDEQLRLENELFASQIIDNESEMRENRKIISQIAEENAALTLELEDLRLEPAVGVSVSDNPLKTEIDSLSSKIADLEHKLEHGYYCCHKRNIDQRAETTGNTSVLTDDETVDHPDVEVTITGEIISAAGCILEAPEADYFMVPRRHAEIIPVEDSKPDQKNEPVVADQDCSFCDCLRVTNEESVK